MIDARSISHSYSSGQQVLDGVDFACDRGETVALTGPSGRGKSTLLFALGLLIRPSSGEVRINGQDMGLLGDRQRSAARAKIFGFLFQEAHLDPTRTVLDSVTEQALYRDDIQRRELRKPALELMASLGVAHRAHHRPRQVSGGQAQRIALCRALLLRPEIIIADEPTGSLDADSAGIVITTLRQRAAEGATVIVATHDNRVVRASDREFRL